MDFQSQRMAETVAKGSRKGGRIDEAAGGGVHFPANGSRLNLGKGSFLSLSHRLIHLLLFVADRAKSHGAGHVGTVAIHKSQNQGDKIPSRRTRSEGVQ